MPKKQCLTGRAMTRICAIERLHAASPTVSRAAAEVATKSHVDATVNKAIVWIILAQLLIAGVAVAFPKLTA